MGSNAALYEQDFYAWTQLTAALTRIGQWHDLDREALAEEVESLGKSDWRALASRLAVLLRHLLTWRYQPEKRQRGRSWRKRHLGAAQPTPASVTAQPQSCPACVTNHPRGIR